MCQIEEIMKKRDKWKSREFSMTHLDPKMNFLAGYLVAESEYEKELAKLKSEVERLKKYQSDTLSYL